MNAGNNEAIPAEATAQAMDGINKYLINMGVETFLPIQSIVVVTSPIGDQAPPALAAITINAAYQILSFLSETMPRKNKFIKQKFVSNMAYHFFIEEEFRKCYEHFKKYFYTAIFLTRTDLRNYCICLLYTSDAADE